MTSNRFRRLFRFDRSARDVERAVDDELQFHFDLTIRELVARGATEAEAHTEAKRRFGDLDSTRDGLAAIDRAHVAQERRTERLSNFAQDLRYAARGLRLRPAFTLSVVLVLALGIGANATMFGIVDRLLFRSPTHIADVNKVHRLYLVNSSSGKETFMPSTSFRRFHELTDSVSALSVAAAFWNPQMAIGVGEPREMTVGFVTASFWKLLDARPALGRFFTANEDRAPEGQRVTVLGYGYWQSAYAGRSDVLGTQLRIGKNDYTIVGVAPQGFSGVENVQQVAFIPLSAGAMSMFPGSATNHWYDNYGLNWLRVVVREKDGMSRSQLSAQLSHAYRNSYASQRRARARTTVPDSVAKPRVLVGSILEERGPNRGADAKVAVWLVGVALVVLLIACANVGNLLLARALQRKREIAVRLALGISRSRLVLQLLVESTLLAVAGGVAALAVAQWGGALLRATLVPTVPWTTPLADIRVLAFTTVATLVSGLLTGVAPALNALRNNLSGSLKAGNREGTYQRSRLRSVLLVAQGALSVVLLVGAGLFVQSLRQVNSTRLGYDPEHLVWASMNMRGTTLDSTRTAVLRDELERAARTVPGVTAVSHGVSVPFYSDWEEDFSVPGIDSVGKFGSFLTQAVTPEYFVTMGTRIVRGRGITVDDRAGAPGAMVVSETMARTLWPGREAIGQCAHVGADSMPCTYVVGIAEDIKRTSLRDDPGLQYYLPYAQFSRNVGFSGTEMYVRTKGDAALSVEALRHALQPVMPGASYVSITTFDEILNPVRRSWELGATMFTLFGVLALIVAAVGLYSVIAYTVTQRTQEMGVRVALGAQTRDVVRLVLTDAVFVSVIAIVIGLGVALAASTKVEPLLFNTSSHDPVVYSGVAVLLVVVALFAGILPARRASRVDPSVALRAE